MSDNIERSTQATSHRVLHIETLTTGDELISGEWIDQHSRSIGQVSMEHGVHVRRFNSVGDQIDDLIAVISEISTRSDLCVITGGLGPTEDDLTLDALAAVANTTLHISEPLWHDILSRFPSLNHAAQSNRRQARVVQGSEILFNAKGTAPGVRIQIGRCTFIAIPGVPQEAEWMISTYLAPWLKKRLGIVERFNQVVRVALIGESVIAERIKSLNLPEGVRVGYQALGTEHRIKVSATTPDLLTFANQQIIRAADDNYLNDQDLSLAEQLVQTAQRYNISFGFAESCTGGQVSAAVTKVPGVSSVFWGSIISYSNEVKHALLQVKEDTLINHGAVSDTCAAEMALGCQNTLGVDWAVSITGIAGPGGGSDKKPVGTVCFGWANPEGVAVQRKQFSGDRHRIQRTAVAYALFTLLRRISSFYSTQLEDMKH